MGDLFADPHSASRDDEDFQAALLQGRISIPLPTYFSIGKQSLPEAIVQRLEARDGELCPNLLFLGKKSTTKLSEGIRIVTLGGVLDPQPAAGRSTDAYVPYHIQGDAKALHGAHDADILLTYGWPSSVRKNSQVKAVGQLEDDAAEDCIAELCTALKPRYHFCSSENAFYEREPFFYADSDGRPDPGAITRFISLAGQNNSQKAKSLYAFSLDPKKVVTGSLIPPGTTASPLMLTNKKRQHISSHDPQNLRYSTDRADRSHGGHPSKKKRSKAPPPGPQECFFCLSNPTLATHLITSIGNDSYLTTAKGPLTRPETYPSLSFPAHILIIPLSHSPTLASVTPEEARRSTIREMTRYRRALQGMVSQKSMGKLGAVTWEVSRAQGIHLHWQFLPADTNLVRKGLAEAGFRVEAENEKYPALQRKKDDESDGHDAPDEDCFRLWIWQPNDAFGQEDSEPDQKEELAGKEMCFEMKLPVDANFDLQYGRRVMAKLLGLESRIQWRECAQSEEEELRDVEQFKNAFKGFDFSLQES